MSYAFIGAPAVYNGTGGDGGDSSKKPLHEEYHIDIIPSAQKMEFGACIAQPDMIYSHHESESVVSIR